MQFVPFGSPLDKVCRGFSFFLKKKGTDANQIMYIFIGLKCGNSKWAVKVVWVRYSLLSLVHLAVVLATNNFTFYFSAEMKVSCKTVEM